MRLLGVTLDDFLGNSFLTFCLVITYVTFSFHLGSLGPNFYLSFWVPFSTGDFMKNDVIATFFASLFVGKEGNGNSSLSLYDPSPKLATFLSFLRGSTPSVMISVAWVSCFDDALFAFPDLVGDSMVFE